MPRMLVFAMLLGACSSAAPSIPDENNDPRYPFLVQFDREPTSADSAAAHALGARSILRVPLARAMTLDFTTDWRPVFNGRDGVTGIFPLTTLDQTGRVDLTYAGPPTAEQLSALNALAKYPVAAPTDGLVVTAHLKYAQVNQLTGASGVVEASIYPHFYFPFMW